MAMESGQKFFKNDTGGKIERQSVSMVRLKHHFGPAGLQLALSAKRGVKKLAS
jgi:hypothetical protein